MQPSIQLVTFSGVSMVSCSPDECGPDYHCGPDEDCGPDEPDDNPGPPVDCGPDYQEIVGGEED